MYSAMCTLNLSQIGRGRLDKGQRLFDLGPVCRGKHRSETFGPLGMAWSGEVVKVHRMSDKEEAHPSILAVPRA
jgi:hypothetical protein